MFPCQLLVRVLLQVSQHLFFEQQYVNCDLSDVQAGFRKGRETRDQIANICWILKKQESSRKTSISALLTMPKPLTVWITTKCGKFLKRWQYQTTDLPPEKSVCRSRSNSQNRTWNNRLVSNWERSTSKLQTVILFIQFICKVHQ